VLDDAESLIVSQRGYSTCQDGLTADICKDKRVSRRMLFKPFPEIEEGLKWRANHSNVTRWSMYLIARIVEGISKGNNEQHYIGWIIRFHQQIIEASTSTELASASLDPYLAGLGDVRDAYSYTSH
jgi:hypothetical protein